ncbi:origin recognition complex subunit 1 [Nematocida sp. ERTm5]|nr:origin recognition complex subunit 1 [Nematocida sp. ERTm5]
MANKYKKRHIKKESCIRNRENKYAPIIANSFISFFMRAVPLGREDESTAIYKLLKESIEEKEYGVLYVSGMPGCGKTLTCNSVLEIVKENYPDVTIASVNCGSLILPSDVFLAIHQIITPSVTQSSARMLEETLKYQPYTIILADEVDMLITKNQHILYGLLELPSLCKNLYIIAISNTFNLPDNKLTGKVRSRLGWNRLNFALYKRSQVVGILKEMHPEYEFTDEALEYCANKICTLNGDIRKALQIQKHAMAHALRNDIKKIEMEDMDRAIKYVYHSMQSSFIRSLSEYQKILLGIVARKGYSFPDSLYVDFRATLSLKQFPLPTFKEFQFLVEKMVEIGVLKGRSNSLAVETDYIPDELDIIFEEEENDYLEVIPI